MMFIKFRLQDFYESECIDKTTAALGCDYEQQIGCAPRYYWIGDQIGPKFGYTYGSDTLPIIEYFGMFQPEKGARDFYEYMYVPVKEIDAMEK